MEEDKKLKFLCIGSATQDVYLRNVQGLDPICAEPDDCFYNVHLGDKIYVNKVDFTTGGGASNAATTFARGGVHVAFMGLIGCDPAASAVLASFATEGIDTQYISYTRRYNTDYSTLLLAPNGERTILTYRGCGMHIKPQHFDIDKIHEQFDWIYLTSLVAHFDIYHQLLESARNQGIRIAFNPGGIDLDNRDEMMKILPYIDVLSVNKQEAQKLVSGDALENLIVELRKYCPTVLITDGVNGSIASDNHETLRAGLYDDTKKSVDRTGAGDSYCSGFVLRYAQGCSLFESIHYASANASSVVQRVGAKAGILRAGDEKKLHPMDIRRIEL